MVIGDVSEPKHHLSSISTGHTWVLPLGHRSILIGGDMVQCGGAMWFLRTSGL